MIRSKIVISFCAAKLLIYNSNMNYIKLLQTLMIPSINDSQAEGRPDVSGSLVSRSLKKPSILSVVFIGVNSRDIFEYVTAWVLKNL